MQLLDHVSITVTDLPCAKPCYEAIMSALGAPKVYKHDDAIGFGQRNRPQDDAHTYFSLYRSSTAAPDPRRHWCFRARSRAEVAAFLRDPEGNRVEAVFHERVRDT